MGSNPFYLMWRGKMALAVSCGLSERIISDDNRNTKTNSSTVS